MTTEDGRFAFPVQKRWDFWPPFDPFPSLYPLSIRHAGYLPYQTTILSYPMGNKPAVKPLGVIRLVPR
jgi:hypothetical protein